MNPVIIRRQGNFMSVTTDDPTLRLSIKMFLTVKQPLDRDQYVTRMLYKNVDDTTLVTWVSYYEHLVVFLIRFGVPIDANVSIPGDIRLTDRWRTILGANPKNPEQLAVTEQFLRYQRGIASLYTGFGKTEMLLAIADSYLTQHPEGRVLITAPGLSTVENLGERLAKYGMSSLASDDIRAIDRCPIIIDALMSLPRTAAFLKGELDTHLAKVTLLIADECHRAGVEPVIRRCPNLIYRYGFSATPNLYNDDMTLMPGEHFASYAYATTRIIQYYGPVRVLKLPKHKSMRYVEAIGRLAPQRVDMTQEQNSTELLKESLLTERFATLVTRLLQDYPEYMFYLPVPVREIGTTLYDRLVADPALADAVIYWDAKAIRPKGLKNLDAIKQKMTAEHSPVRLLISTQVGFEGIDIPAINACILACGKNIRVTLQPIGRSARADHLMVINVGDLNNPAVMSQFNKRQTTVDKNYTVSAIEKVSF